MKFFSEKKQNEDNLRCLSRECNQKFSGKNFIIVNI